MKANKRLAKNTIILYVKLIITSVLGLIVTRKVIDSLGIADYGLYSVVASVVVMMDFLNSVMITTTFRYIAFEIGKDDIDRIRDIFSVSFFIHLSLSFLIIIISETLGIWYIENHLNVDIGRSNDAIFVFRLSVMATIINVLSIPFQGYLTAVEKFSIKAIIEIMRVVLKLIFVSIIAYVTMDKLRVYSILMAVLTLIISLIYIIYCNVKYRQNIKIRFVKKRKLYTGQICLIQDNLYMIYLKQKEN